jgi:hypothetical protein
MPFEMDVLPRICSKRAAIRPKDRRNRPRNSAGGMRAKNGSPKESVQELKMTAFRGWTISVGLVLAASAANAQGAAPQDSSRAHYVATSDFSRPYADVPPGAAVSAPAYGPQGYAPTEYGPGYGPPLMPPREIYAVLRENGFSPLGMPRLRGFFYSIAAIDRRGDDGRLVVDARNGQIVRFVPADRFGGYGEGYYGGAPRPSHGALEPMTRLDGTHLIGPPPPLAAMAPKIASRMPQTVPVPKAAPQRSGGETPLADKLTPAPAPAPVQQSAAVELHPVVVPSAASRSTASPPEVKPVASAIQPTQPMPKVQDLE